MQQLRDFVSGLARGLKPRPKQTITEWAESHVTLPPERAASPGPYRAAAAPFQRGMLDACADIAVEEVVFQTSSQVGKTTVLGIIQAYFAEAEPSPQLCVLPTQVIADGYAVEVFDAIFNASPALQGVLSSNRKQTTDYKTYPGGYIAFVGAQTPANLANRPIRVVTGDEVDRWPISSGKEGSPLDLARRRTANFPNRKMIWASTPVLKASSVIVNKYEASDKRVYRVACPHCKALQVLEWDRVLVAKGKETAARYQCAADDCGTLWTEFEKRQSVMDAETHGGGWFATAPFKGIAGFFINALYSPWATMSDLATTWFAAQGNPVKEQTFTNTFLGLPWDGDVSASADAESLKMRREPLAANRLPAGAALVTAGVDVQDDRIEVLYTAWGVGDESWYLDRVVIPGDPSVPRVWQGLDEALSRRFSHPLGAQVGVEVAAIDSGGHHTQTVYAYASRNEAVGRRWHAIKGVAGENKPLWVQSQMRKRGVKLHLVGVDDAKSTLFLRFGISAPGPGYVHIPEHFTDAMIEQLTSERAETEYTDGFPRRVWRKEPGKRNEMLDMAVYAIAARASIQIDIATRLQMWASPVKPLDPFAVGKAFK